MIIWEQKYFQKFDYTQVQLAKYFESARKDLHIAKNANVTEVRFQFAYNALIKMGICLIACHGYKVRSQSGHHIKILEQSALILNNEEIAAYGNQMRKMSNTELYDGGLLISGKQADEYFNFVENIFFLAETVFEKHLHTLF